MGDERLEAGEKAPPIKAPADGGRELDLATLRGRKVVLYFYPKDDTPGCTKEACGFRDELAKFKRSGAEVVGVSKDGPASHDKFKAKYELPFTLVSDGDGAICKAYGVWVKKKNYGREYMGVERSTFLIDAKGKIAKVWRGVKVAGHVEEVLEAVKALG